MLIIHQHNLCVPTAQKGYYDNMKNWTVYNSLSVLQ